MSEQINQPPVDGNELSSATPEQIEAAELAAQSVQEVRVAGNQEASATAEQADATVASGIDVATTPPPTPEQLQKQRFDETKATIESATAPEEIEAIIANADLPDEMKEALAKDSSGHLKNLKTIALEKALEKLPFLGGLAGVIAPFLGMFGVKLDGDIMKGLMVFSDWWHDKEFGSFIASLQKSIWDIDLSFELDFEDKEFTTALSDVRDYINKKIPWVKASTENMKYLLTGETDLDETDINPILVTMRENLAKIGSSDGKSDFIAALSEPKKLTEDA